MTIKLQDKDMDFFEKLSKVNIATQRDLEKLKIIGEKRIRTLIKEGYLKKTQQFIYLNDQLKKDFGCLGLDLKKARHDAGVAQVFFGLTRQEQATWQLDRGDRMNSGEGAPDATYINQDGVGIAVEIVTKNYRDTQIESKKEHAAQAGYQLTLYRI